MADRARPDPNDRPFVAAQADEDSVVRSRDVATASARPRQESSAGLRVDQPSKPARSHSSVRPAVSGSLDDRIEQKLRLASALLRDLPPEDTRVRLLHVAIMRRDESLLDGVLAELSRPSPGG